MSRTYRHSPARLLEPDDSRHLQLRSLSMSDVVRNSYDYCHSAKLDELAKLFKQGEHDGYEYHGMILVVTKMKLDQFTYDYSESLVGSEVLDDDMPHEISEKSTQVLESRLGQEFSFANVYQFSDDKALGFYRCDSYKYATSLLENYCAVITGPYHGEARPYVHREYPSGAELHEIDKHRKYRVRSRKKPSNRANEKTRLLSELKHFNAGADDE